MNAGRWMYGTSYLDLEIERSTMMRRIMILIGVFLAVGFADEAAEAGRIIIEKWQAAVIQVKLVIEVNEYESKSEALATVIDPKGLCAMSLSAIDPNSMRTGSSSVPGFTSKLKDLKMILADGNEIPAQVVLRDPDLDLAFIKPQTPLAKPAAFLELKENIVPEILEPFVILSRMGEAAGREIYIPVSRIQGIISKPRTVYIPDMNGMMSGLAAPAFTFEGKVLGIILLRVSQSETGMTSEMYGGMSNMNIIPVIVPASTVIEAARKIPK
jgi:hypothetical protein